MNTAVILAAGESRRMGRPKMLLPWGGSTVLQTVISTFEAAGVDKVLVVTGAAREQVEALVHRPAQIVFNAAYAAGEMLSSIQAGLDSIKGEPGAALIGLGDQPQVELGNVERLLRAYTETADTLIVPSFKNHRGHPWLVAHTHWDEILAMRSPQTMRDFFQLHAGQIHYVEVDTPGILADLDTPEDYQKYRP